MYLIDVALSYTTMWLCESEVYFSVMAVLSRIEELFSTVCL